MKVTGCADGGKVAITQACCAALCLTALAIWPFGRPELLLIPTTTSLAATIDLALANDARLVGPGPIRRSVRVTGDAARIVAPMLRHGTLVIGLPASLCAGRTA
jgi:hypothetical protein